jgi:hypothetical protein
MAIGALREKPGNGIVTPFVLIAKRQAFRPIMFALLNVDALSSMPTQSIRRERLRPTGPRR